LDKIFTIKKKVKEVLPQLKAERYDCIVDLHKNLRSLQVKWGLGIKSYSFNKLNFEKWLLVNFKINRLPEAHIVDRYLAAAAPLGVRNDGEGLDYFFPKNHPAPTVPQPPYVAFACPRPRSLKSAKKVPCPSYSLAVKTKQQKGSK
jgi:ADP-heptose:LPS heptosyltransferase